MNIKQKQLKQAILEVFTDESNLHTISKMLKKKLKSKNNTIATTKEESLILKHCVFPKEDEYKYKDLTAKDVIDIIQSYYSEDIKLSTIRTGRELSKFAKKRFINGIASYAIKDVVKKKK